MHPDWICNGMNDCGDNSDELDCLIYDCKPNPIPSPLIEAINISIPVLYNKTYINCRWRIEALKDNTLRVKIHELILNEGKDVLIIKDGENISSYLGKFSNSSENTQEIVLVTSGNLLWMNFFSDQNDFSPNFTVEIIPQAVGKHVIGEGIITIEKQEPNVISYFTLETSKEKQISITHNISTDDDIPSYEICFYDQLLENELACFHSTNESFPIVSASNEVIVSATNFSDNLTSTLNIRNIWQGNKFFSYHDMDTLLLSSVSNETTIYLWRIKPEKKGIIILTLNHLELQGNNTVVIFGGMSRFSDQIIKEFHSSLNGSWTIDMDSDKGIILLYTCYQSISGTAFPVIEASYEVISKSEFSKETELKLHENVYILSPNYPNQYPIYATYSWCYTLPSFSSNLTYLVFEDIDLLKEHPLKISSLVDGKVKELLSVSGQEIPDDLLIKGQSIYFTWSSVDSTDTDALGKGFKIRIRSIDCGENLHMTSLSFSPISATAECVWIVSGSEHSMIQFTEASNEISEKNLEIFDGGSSHCRPMNYSSNTQILSRHNKLLFRYNIDTQATNPGDKISVSYTVKDCSDKKDQCENGFCIHANWRCDGKNDCGDNTDELGCISSKQEGVSSGIVVLVCFITFGIGILAGVLIVPKIVEKCRSWRSSRYVQLTESAS